MCEKHCAEEERKTFEEIGSMTVTFDQVKAAALALKDMADTRRKAGDSPAVVAAFRASAELVVHMLHEQYKKNVGEAESDEGCKVEVVLAKIVRE